MLVTELFFLCDTEHLWKCQGAPSQEAASPVYSVMVLSSWVMFFLYILFQLTYFLKFMCLKKKGALFFLWRNVFPDAPGLGLFVVLSPEVRRAVCAFNSGLLHKKCLYWELWPSSCASKLDFPLHGITLSVLLNEIGQHLEKSIRFTRGWICAGKY